MFDKLSEDQRQALNIVREENNLFITGQGGTARKNNCFLSSIFPAGEGGFGQMMSPERSLQDSRDGSFLYSAQASLSWPRVDLALLDGISCLPPCILLLYMESIWTNYHKTSLEH